VYDADAVLRLGPYQLPNPWILAPMAGVSEMPFRVIAREMGAGAAPTELVSAKGLLYGQERTQRYLTHAPVEQPFWVQIFGGDPESMAAGAERAVELGAKILDINMGCPVKKVTKGGAGSALLCDPRRAASIVEAMAKRTGVPVTVKIRSGWDDTQLTFVDMARCLADAGAVAVAMHARTRAQGYSGTAKWALIRELVDKSPIPVIGNGDAFTPELARKLQAETGCAAVMIGRGALGNPWIFAQLTQGVPPPTPRERWGIVKRHLLEHIDFVGDESRGLRRFRQHLLWYARGLRDAAAFRGRVVTVDDLDELLERCEAFFCGAEADGVAPQAAEFDTAAALG
jgi:tRNA-dihydrouridine synthase B